MTAPASNTAGVRFGRLLQCLALIAAFAGAHGLAAQHRPADLSENEVESIRDAAATPMLRVEVYRKIIDDRVTRMQDVLAKKYAPGHKDDLHEAMQQITAISDELEDNLEEYDVNHGDVRKSLPKLLDSIERWNSVLKQAPEDTLYEVSRHLALEAVADLKEIATRLVPEQKAWFTAHPPAKDAGRPAREIEVPR